jgi:two-component system chemotaxis response regulator CheB
VNRLIRVLIVDDSAFVRKVVREILTRSPYIEVVDAARDGEEALELAAQLEPDIITCDLVMPRMDGVAFVREQMARRPVPILVLTATPEDGEKALQAMDAGAVDVIQKPTSLANEELFRIRDELVEKVKALAGKPMRQVPPIAPLPLAEGPRPRSVRTSKIKIVVIGVSTGGPQALRYLIPQFPADFPVPIAVVLHMPVGYTEMFAKRLNEISLVEVMEAKTGTEFSAGRMVLAQAGKHLALKPCGEDKFQAEITAFPLEMTHKPSVDVLFQSAAQCCGEGVLGVVLTGMGDDGKQGAAWIKAQGGTILTEAEESCVIFGMPRSVVEAGLSDAEVPLRNMAQKIMDQL